MTDQIRLAVVVPSHGEWKAGMGYALANMVAFFYEAKYEGPPKTLRVFNVSGSILPQTRMACVREALKWQATHILWLDADMMFPADLALQLLSRNLPIVGVNYVRRKMPIIPTAHTGTEKLYTKPEDTGVVEVAHLGFGCLLTDIRVFLQMDEPYFMFEVAPDGLSFIGEDVYFCRKAKDLGIPTFCDQDASQKIGHIGEMMYTHSHAQVQLEVNKQMEAAE